MLQGIEKFVQYINADESTWNEYLPPIPNMSCIICKSSINPDQYILKIGDGINRFIDLPIFMTFDKILNTHLLDSLKINLPQDLNKILYLDDNLNIVASDITVDSILQCLSLLNTFSFRNNIFIPLIIGPNQAKYGDTINLKVNRYALADNENIELDKIVWHLPDGTNITTTSNNLSYTIPNNSTLVNTKITFKAEIYMKNQDASRIGSKTITIIGSTTNGYIDIPSNEFKFQDNLENLLEFNHSWSSSPLYSGSTYTLILNFKNTNLDLSSLEYDIISSDSNINITSNNNVFNIKFPLYISITLVYFLITVKDPSLNISYKKGIKVLVNPPAYG